MLEWVEYNGPWIEQAMLVGVVVAGVWWLVRNRSRRARESDPLCGRCGYNVRGLPSKVCPECGSDLDVVGVVRGDRSPPYWLWAIVWSVGAWLLLSVVAGFLYQKLARGLPVYRDADVTVDLNEPASKAYRRILIKYSWRGVTTAQALVPHSMSIWIHGDSGAIGRPMAIDAATLKYGYEDETGKGRSGTLDAAAIVDWMKASQVNGDDGLLAAEAQEILRAVQRAALRPSSPGSPLLRPPFRGGTGMSSGQSTRWAARPWLALMAGAFLIWAAGVWLIGRSVGRGDRFPNK